MRGLFELKDVELLKNNQTILDKVSLTINEGDIIGVVGPSGAGKSSLFRLLNLLGSPTGGSILYQGQSILEYDPLELRRQIGYVLQKPTLFGSTVHDNLNYPYQLRKQQPDAAEIRSYLEQVSLPAAVQIKRTTDLSGGEQQRIALVRSLLIKPRVLLLDEVTAALDEENTLLIEKLVLNEQSRRKLTVLFISHSNDQIKRLAQKILQLTQGKVQYYGLKDEYSGAGSML